ncbi:MAG TPA: DNA polymerase/3'-5' exonuclease PolX [Gemmatimonadales bacterium]|nr:DNA polymerase/3'-5' exonuclease PolX [Gemmatimonadales bacterium]
MPRIASGIQNSAVAQIFDEVADLLEIQGENPFRVRAYRNAARTVRDLPEAVTDLVRRGERDLTELPSIGTDIAEKIRTIVTTGGLPLHKELCAKVPPGLLQLLRIPGLGPKRVKLLHAKLKITSAADLQTALDSGRVGKIKGFGPKTQEQMRAALGQKTMEAGPRRLLLFEAEEQAEALRRWLEDGGSFDTLTVAGSYRRRRETVGDLDFLVTSAATANVIARFTSYPGAVRVISKGEIGAAIELQNGLRADLRALEPDAYGAGLLYFTGSKAHNIELRQIAQARDLKLNEYGLFKGSRRVAGRTEAEIYEYLGLDFIPPELREARGEIALAREHRLPKLVELAEIKGDLQMHTTATDGRATLEEMAAGAQKLGYEYIAITDHSKRVSMALGFDAARLREQWAAIDKLNARTKGFTILKSIEMDILENGEMDLPDDVLAEADYVVATIHYGLNQSSEQLTHRLLAAIRHPFVDAIGHPTGRRLGRRERESYAVDFETVVRAAVESRCLLEIDGHPERMDLPDTLAAAGKRAGARFVLSTDSHAVNNLPFMKYAVDVARRAGLESRDILNTRSLAEFRRGLKRAVKSGSKR